MLMRINLHEDELLYSALARYSKVSANTSIKDTQFDAFLSKTKSASVELPSSIDILINQMPIGTTMTPDIIISEHTNLRYYVVFKSDDLRIRAMMQDSNGSGIYAKTGIMASSVKSKQFFWYCPECFSESLLENGEVYWHRHHQIPGVLLCYKHNVLLRKSEIQMKRFNKHEFHAAEFLQNTYEVENDFNDEEMEILQRISKYSYDLLTLELPNRDSEWFRNQYIARLKQIGLATINGRVDRKRLKNEFIDYFGEKLLIILQLDGDINKWITKLLSRKSSTLHPLQHLIFAIFLGLNVHGVFYEEIIYNPFGEAPWPCLNPICSDYKELVIEDYRVRHNHDTKRPQGYFKCSVCGYEYSRFGPDSTLKDRFHNNRVVEYGDLWKKKLSEYLALGTSYRQIAKKLHVDTGTVIKYSKLLNEGGPTIEKDSLFYEKNKRRSEWLASSAENPELSKTQLRKLNQGLYIWLYRNDRVWLNSNSPKPQQGSNINKRVDWEKRDTEILEALKSAYENILDNEDQKLRVTKTGLSKLVGGNCEALISRHLCKLPRCEMFLESVVESHRDYRRRRVEIAIEEVEAENIDLEFWRICRLAGIRKEYYEEVRSLVERRKTTGI